MNTEKPQSERCTTSENKESSPTTDQWTSRFDAELPDLHESITDHETKCLRIDEPKGERADRNASLLHYRGPFRVYFNRKEEAPRLISIDNGTHAWEIVCKAVRIDNLKLRSTLKPDAVYPEPAFTLEGFGWVPEHVVTIRLPESKIAKLLELLLA